VSRTPSSPERVARAKRLGAYVEARRKQAGMSREALARHSEISTETLRKIEKGGTSSPELFTFAAIMNSLNASIDQAVEAVDSVAINDFQSPSASD
jgi:transcriptional regulator with XRE-family HTH domain